MYSVRKQVQQADINSWLLIEILQIKTADFFRKRQYVIKHATDIIASDLLRISVNCIVRFNHNEKMLLGKARFIANQYFRVEQYLAALKANMPVHSTQLLTNEQLFLIQYRNGDQRLTFAIVPRSAVLWPELLVAQQREVMIHDGQQKQMATLLFTHTDKNVINIEFQKLKTWCFNKAFDDNDYESTIADDAWVLVQHNCGLSNSIFNIRNLRETVLQEHNQYKDAVAYLRDNDNVILAIVVRKSHSLNELQQQLRLLSARCQILDFPLQNYKIDAIPPSNFKSMVNDTSALFMKGSNQQCVEMLNDVENMENAFDDGVNELLEFSRYLKKMRKIKGFHLNN